MDNYLIEKYLGEAKGLRKDEVFKGLLNVLNNTPMNIDQIFKEAKLPISKNGLIAHIEELVKKGKVKESMKKGNRFWSKA